MIDFLKNFLSGDKTPEEQALVKSSKVRDILMVSGESDETQPEPEACDDEPSYGGGCCGGGCRS